MCLCENENPFGLTERNVYIHIVRLLQSHNMLLENQLFITLPLIRKILLSKQHTITIHQSHRIVVAEIQPNPSQFQKQAHAYARMK